MFGTPRSAYANGDFFEELIVELFQSKPPVTPIALGFNPIYIFRTWHPQCSSADIDTQFSKLVHYLVQSTLQCSTSTGLPSN